MKLGLSFAVLGLLVAVPAWASDTKPAVAPTLPVIAPKALPDVPKPVDGSDPMKVPMLANLVNKQGAKLFPMGERSGLSGWLVLMNGGIQIVYVTQDLKTVLMGGMFSSEGELLTAKQMQSVLATSGDLKAIVSEFAAQQVEAVKAGSSKDGFASLPASKDAGKVEAKKDDKAAPSVALSPGDRLLKDLQASAGVTLGKNEQAPLYMIVNPNCPHCKKTWLEMRDAVQKNQIQVKIIPLSGGDVESGRASARLLQSTTPFEAWDKFVGGDKTALAGETDVLHQRAVESNDVLTDRWDIQVTPYIVYRGKDSQVKIVQGRPDRIAALLSDVVR